LARTTLVTVAVLRRSLTDMRGAEGRKGMGFAKD
jgi:hypothetical protein